MNYIFYRIKLRELNKQREQIHQRYKDWDPEPVDPGNPNMGTTMPHEYKFDLDVHDLEIETLITKYYLILANEHMISVVGNESYWYRDGFSNQRFLTGTAKREIKRQVREDRSYYLLWFAAATGILGTLTGLIATIKA